MSVLENVALPGVYKGLDLEERTERAENLLDKLKLSEKIHNLPGELSGGQQQRVAIARALMNNPEIILADEPTGNLDSVTAREIMKLLLEFHNQGKTIIMVTHAHDLAAYAERIIVLSDGKVVK